MSIKITSPLLKSIVDHLKHESLRYKKKKPQTIHIMGYDRSTVTANLMLNYTTKRQHLSIDTDRDLVIEAAHRLQIMEFLNYVNAVLSDGNFHICPDCSRLTYRKSFVISDEPMEPEHIEQEFDHAVQLYQLFASQVELLVKGEITYDAAIAYCGGGTRHE